MMTSKFLAAAVLLTSAYSAHAGTFSMNDFQFGQWSQLRDTGIGCELIAGNNVTGPVIASGPENRMLRYMSNYGLNQWQTIPDPGVAVQFLTGDNSNGPIVANSGAVKYLSSYAAGTWIPLATPLFAIQGITGDNLSGVTIFNGPHLAVLKSYSSNSWERLSRVPAPFVIKGISGNNRTGVVAFGGADSNQIAYLDRFVGGNWVALPAPVQGGEIVAVTGDNQNGPIVSYKSGEMFYMPSYAQRRWTQISINDFANISKLTGNSLNGIVFCD